MLSWGFYNEMDQGASKEGKSLLCERTGVASAHNADTFCIDLRIHL